MVFNQTVRLEYIRANLVAPADFGLLTFQRGQFSFTLFNLFFQQTRFQELHRAVLVIELRAFILALYHDAGGQVGDAYGRVGFVNVLAACAAAAVGVDFQLIGIDGDFVILLYLRHNIQRGKRGVTACRGIKRRNAHQTVNALFRAEVAVSVRALNAECYALQAGLFAVQKIHNLALKAVFLAEAGIHTVQHIRPILRLGAACTGVQREDAVVVIIRAAEQYLDLQFLQIGRESVKVMLHLFGQRFITLLGAQLPQGMDILQALTQRVIIADNRFKHGQLLQGALRRFLVIPEAGLGGQSFQTGSLILFARYVQSFLKLLQFVLGLLNGAFPICKHAITSSFIKIIYT